MVLNKDRNALRGPWPLFGVRTKRAQVLALPPVNDLAQGASSLQASISSSYGLLYTYLDSKWEVFGTR